MSKGCCTAEGRTDRERAGAVGMKVGSALLANKRVAAQLLMAVRAAGVLAVCSSELTDLHASPIQLYTP
jgi:hypothetical protein